MMIYMVQPYDHDDLLC